ncbi:MAG: cystathionine gamma-lyase [Solirubrobacterales bacterium]|nr:cystathionine gamma-lyase [Solirubrobacterales bacterium]
MDTTIDGDGLLIFILPPGTRVCDLRKPLLPRELRDDARAAGRDQGARRRALQGDGAGAARRCRRRGLRRAGRPGHRAVPVRALEDQAVLRRVAQDVGLLVVPAGGGVSRGDSTRTVHAGLPEAAPQGAPFLPGPTFAAPVHWAGDAAPEGYGRNANPTWAAYEAALGELEGGHALAFASGMAAASAILLPALRPGDAVVVPADGYYTVRALAREHLAPRGVEVREVPTRLDALVAAADGAALVWAESPSNPGLGVLDLPALAAACHDAGAALAVDATLATPLRIRPLEAGADWAMGSATKALTGHGDLLLGYVATRDEQRLAAARTWRTSTGAIPGAFEAWLAHRSLATLAVRLERAEANASALAEALRGADGVRDVRWPGMGPVLVFTLPDAAAAQRFLAACELVAEATSFGGVHSSAERRARWGSDDVPDGLVRFSAGIEDAEDLVADVLRALSAALGRE